MVRRAGTTVLLLALGGLGACGGSEMERDAGAARDVSAPQDASGEPSCTDGAQNGTETDVDDGILMSADRTPNGEAVRRLQAGEFTADALKTSGDGKVLVVFENDLAALAGEDALEACAAVVVIGTDASGTTERAEVVLPGLKYAEKIGTFVNKDGRAQALHPAFPGPVEARDPIRIVKELAEVLGQSLTWEDADAVRAEIAATVDGFGALAAGIGPKGVALDGTPDATDPVGGSAGGEEAQA